MKKLQLFLILAFATSFAGLTQVTTISQTVIGAGWYSGWDELAAQSFTITQAGYITEIHINTYTPEGITTFEIREGQDVNGTLLYSTVINVTTSGWITVPVPNIPVCEGVYCYTQSGWQYGAVNTADPYPGGSYYYLGSWPSFGDQPFEIVQIIDEQPSSSSSFTNQSVCVGGSATPTVFNIVDESPGTVLVTASSSNPSVIPNGSLTITGSGSSRTLSIAGPLTTPGNSTITVTLSDAICSESYTFDVQVNPLPPVSAGPNQVVCAGSSVTLNGSGADFYSWNLGVSDGIPFSPGVGTVTYTVTGTDLNGCLATDAATVTVNALPVVTFGAVPQQCIDGASYTLTQGTPAGGTYSGAGISGTIFNPPSAGIGPHTATYSYTDVNLCTATASQTITVNSLPVVNFPPLADVCENAGAVSLTTGTPAGGTYTGVGVGSSVFNPSITGPGPQIIDYTYTDGGTTCTNTASATITVISPPTVNAGTNSTVCSGTSVTLNGSGTAGSFTWDNGVTDGVAFTPAVGTITYTVTGDDGICQNTATVDVTVLPLPVVSFSAVPDQCIDGAAYTLTEGSPAGGSYSGPGVTGSSFNPATAGVGVHTLTFDYTDGNGCYNSASQTVTVSALPVLSFPVLSDVCINATPFALSSATPAGGSYSGPGVTGGTFDPSVAGLGTHSITYTYTDGTTGCTNSIVQNVLVYDAPAVVANTTQTAVCDGESITLNGGGAVSYTWDNGASDGIAFAPPLGSTIYTVTGTDGNGCQNTDQITITVNALPTIGAGADVSVCQNVSVTLNGSNGVSYVWDNGVTDGVAFVPPVGTTTYTVTGTDGNGCQNTDAVIVDVIALPVLIVSPDDFFCEGETVTLTVSGAATYDWNSGAGTGTSFDISPVANTSVQVSGTSAGCSSSETISLTLDDPSLVDAGAAVTVCKGYIAYLNASGGVSYTWNGPGVVNVTEGNHGFIVDSTAYYYLTAVTAEGCTYTDSVLVTASMDPSCVIEPLTTFSPNGDAVNDSWKIQGIESFPENHVTILNRWGDIVFDELNYDNETVIWGGTLKTGSEAPAGTYYFIVEIANGPTATGWIQLLK